MTDNVIVTYAVQMVIEVESLKKFEFSAIGKEKKT